jgi:hypothetical protein
MTWIVGVPVQFGYAIGCADIRVTFKDGREKDCLQKIYQVGPVVCAAFAGSIRVGFELLTRTAQLLKGSEPGMAWDLDEVAKWWPEDAREVWNRMPGLERALRSEFMLFGAHPQVGNPWAKPCIYTFRSPDFEPVPTRGSMEACSLGKGAGIRTYCDPLKNLWANEELIRLEAGSPGGIAKGMVSMITEKLLAVPIKGISPHLHVLLAFRDHVEGRNNNIQYIKNRSMELEDVSVMPAVAVTYDAFMKDCGGAVEVEGASG